jgi:hypothetical protein
MGTPGAGAWSAVQPIEVAALLSAVKVPWWIAGGWAIDLFLDKHTRAHRDIDVGVLRRDAHQVMLGLPSWEFFAAKGRTLTRLPPGETPPADVFSLWCRPTSTSPWTLELLIDSAEDNWWMFRREPKIRRPFATITHLSSHGIPYLAPEIQLLYKSKATRPEDQADFESSIARLDIDVRAWLRAALLMVYPSHQWLSALEL